MQPFADPAGFAVAKDLGRSSSRRGSQAGWCTRRHAARPAGARTMCAILCMSRSVAVRALPSLRSARVFSGLRGALAAASHSGFRVVHFSVQIDHVHLVVEADVPVRLSRGVQGLAIRCARAVNRCVGRRGAVWSDRFHARALATPREVRHGMVYVLLNYRKHLRAGPRDQSLQLRAVVRRLAPGCESGERRTSSRTAGGRATHLARHDRVAQSGRSHRLARDARCRGHGVLRTERTLRESATGTGLVRRANIAENAGQNPIDPKRLRHQPIKALSLNLFPCRSRMSTRAASEERAASIAFAIMSARKPAT